MKPYKKISAYPHIIRDVAVWVPSDTSETEVRKVINESAGGLLMEDPILFDRFPKDNRISLAFRGIFQSYERTLTDEEVSRAMDKIISALKNKGWEVR